MQLTELFDDATLLVYVYVFSVVSMLPPSPLLPTFTFLPFHFLYTFSEECGAGGTGNSHTNDLSDMVGAFVEDYHLALFGATAQLFAATLAEVLYENIKLFAFITLVGYC